MLREVEIKFLTYNEVFEIQLLLKPNILAFIYLNIHINSVKALLILANVADCIRVKNTFELEMLLNPEKREYNTRIL